MPALLDVRHLWKSFGGVHAVRDCSFDVEAGRITGLIGPNGAGKSTAIDLISGFLKPDAGVIRFAGLDVGGRPAHRVARLGLVRTFQSPRVWAGLTVMENMLLAAPEGGREEVWRAVCTPARLRESEDADRVQARAILGEFGLLPLKNDPAGNLSGGQKRLLEIARIFQARPRMVLMDEPLTGVNPVLGGRIGEGIAYVPQVQNVFPTLTVRENLEVGGYTRAAGLRDRIEFITTMFPDLGAAMKRPARTLSGGQRNMLAMARGLMVDPAVLLLDEPSTGLSPRFIATVWEHIRAVCRSGVAVVVVEQNTRQTLAQAAWAYVMALGATRLAGPGPDLLRDEEVVDLYVGRLT